MTIEAAYTRAAHIIEICTCDEPLDEWEGWKGCRDKLEQAIANALTDLEKETVSNCIRYIQDAMGAEDNPGIQRIRREFTLSECLPPSPRHSTEPVAKRVSPRLKGG